MPRYVAFLRGINLGTRRVQMDALRRHFEALGFDGVATFIASGNVVLDADEADAAALERRIEAHLQRALGFGSDTFLRTLTDLKRLSSTKEIGAREMEGFNVHVIFQRGRVAPKVRAALRALESDDDRFLASAREVVWFRRGRLTDSSITDRDLGLALGSRENTMRNFNTVRRIIAKFGETG